MASVKKPKITSLLLSDAHRVSENGKIDAFGLFTKFLVWNIPATRECSIIAKIDNPPVGEIEFEILVQNEDKISQEVASFSVKSESDQYSALPAFRLPITFSNSGKLKIGIKPKGGSDRELFWSTFFVEVLPWLELPTGNKLEQILSDPHSIKHMRASIACAKCAKAYTFELSLQPIKTKERGIKPFPKNKKFKCPACSHSNNLGDIEGQLRYHLVNQGQGSLK
jgi:hypothetical protein